MDNLFLSHLLKQEKKLPTLPAIAAQLLEAVQKDDPAIGDISAIISNDPPLSIEVLKFVNSPYFGFRRKISSVHHAAQMLGINALKNLALSFALIKTFGRQSNGFDYSDFWKDSLVAAVSCKLIAQAVQPEFAEDAFFLGLLHDIGILIFVEYLPSEYQPVIQEVKEEKTHLAAVENQILGFDHMQIGSHLVNEWGLPDIMVYPIRFHHHPDQQDSDSEPLVTATRILHLSTLFTEFFQKPEESLGMGVIRHFIDRYGFSSALDVGALLEKTNAQVSEVLPAFDIGGYDRECYQEIIERAREELLNVSFDYVQKLVEQRQQIETLKQNVSRDGLTSLYNHKWFHEVLQQEIQRAVRYHSPLSIIFADIDDFKTINDGYGHLAGDKVLKILANILRTDIRETDYIARYGGEEFAIICTETPLEGALVIGQRLLSTVSSHSFVHENGTIRLTISIGVASTDPGEPISPKQLIDRADKALYNAKENGKNCCCGYL